jgi:fermentation-respiration switch protein FrsA (DUF1100 family)
MYFAQPGMIFFPTRAMTSTPQDWGMDYEEISFGADDGVKLNGWYIPYPGAQRTLLFFHGNAGNISHRGDSIAIFHRLGINVFIVDYRGYGRSEGVPSEAGMYKDAAAAWRYVTQTRGVKPADVVVFGRSLGGAVAAHLAAQEKPAALILESTLSSARDFAHRAFPLLSRLVVLRYDLATAQYVQGVSCPVLVLHSPDDEIMPFELGERVYHAAPQPKLFVRLVGDHNGGFLLSQPAYEQALSSFLTSR